MSTGALQRVTRQYRRDLANHEAVAQRTLNNAYTHTLSAIQPTLNKLYREIAEKRQRGEPIPASWLYEQHRLEVIKQVVTQQIGNYGMLTRAQVAELQRYGVALGNQSGQALLQASVPSGIQYVFGVPDQRALSSLVGANQPGSPLYELFNSFGPQAADDVGKALLTGLTLGNSPAQVARSVAAALDIPRARALTIARDQMNRAYRSAAMENYRTNSDVVDSWIWCCELSARTCAACIFMNGTEHSLDEDLDEHVCGRCTAVPKTKSWDDILGGLGVDTSDLEDTSPDIESGSDWFDNQDASVQREILGNAKYDAWSNNQFTLSQIVGRHDDPQWGGSIYVKSLKQLKGK